MSDTHSFTKAALTIVDLSGVFTGAIASLGLGETFEGVAGYATPALTLKFSGTLDAGDLATLTTYIANYTAGAQTIPPITGPVGEDEKFYVKTPYVKTLLLEKEEWYRIYNEDGTFSQLSRSITYTYKGRDLKQEDHKTFSVDGTELSHIVYTHHTLPDGRIFRKKE